MNEKRDALVQAKRAGTPSYSFKVGDSVILGAIESVHVEKVLYDGLCYEVCCTKVDKTTGKRTLEHRIEPWYKIRPKFFGKSEFTTNEVIRQNKAIDNARRAFERKVNQQSARVDEAIKQYLKDEFDFGDAVAAEVFEMAWEHGHPCGFDEVLIDAQSYGEFVKSILAAYEKERNV